MKEPLEHRIAIAQATEVLHESLTRVQRILHTCSCKACVDNIKKLRVSTKALEELLAQKG